MTAIKKIILPTSPQPDTLVAIFLLKKFGEEKFPGIKGAGVEIWKSLPEGKSAGRFAEDGFLLMDIGRGMFDHHGKKGETASTLVAGELGISEDPALAKMIEYAKRDDLYGKGTISNDPIDRAFGFSALVYHLNRSLNKNPEKTVELAMPFLIAHYNEEKRRCHELPAEFEKLKKTGEAGILEVRHKGKKVKVVIIESDSLGLPGYLRSRDGGAFDVVCQIFSSGHKNILTRPAKRIDLRGVAALIRIRESELAGENIDMPLYELSKRGRIKEVPEWYYDLATNSLQNGGTNPKDTPQTKISADGIKKMLELGLEKGLNYKE